MDLVKNIIAYLNNNPNKHKRQAPENFCPNCWGRQEYGGNFHKAIKAETFKDLAHKKGWITSYVEQNLKGIQLHKEKKLVCNVCFEICEN
ncbi:hypothetical protein KO566_12415 [Flavobacteriaceae bacterium XHP0103]|uniref:hypothetical protein n=1 Tax=Marixanthotalea marina TaxID=2844359 RepID=UPI00298A0320|nr:hypothetical protein [Marixanthotalea marina]MBU3822868.1 hypothetical protein [Marixanthotalea marina]